MRIIKQGKLPNPEVTQTCHKCNTKFAYTKEDVHYDHRDGNYVKCPTCGAFIASKDQEFLNWINK